MSARKYKKKGHTVQIVIKYSDFKSITRQMSVPPTCLVKDIYTAGVHLLKANWNRNPVRLLGISLSGFDKNHESKQISLFELPKSDNEMTSNNKIDSLENAIHNIRQKYGSSIIKPGTLMDLDNNRKL
ncbi:DNA polymerase IV [bioreactor metagenome]